jgi:RHH-type rel operon transcriptional repressor/antitoxin RelB
VNISTLKTPSRGKSAATVRHPEQLTLSVLYVKHCISLNAMGFIMLGVRLEPELEKRLDAIAAKTGRSKSYYVREAIRAMIEDWEDTATAITALENPGRRWSMEEVERELDLEG